VEPNGPNSDNRRWWVLVAVGASTFISALDGSVVNTSLPVIKSIFHSDVATIEWVITIYLLVISGFLLSFGRLGDILGHKPVFISGFIMFIISSALCGLSPTVNALIIFRGFQAISAAMLQSNSPAILSKSFPSSELGRALGLAATMTYLGLTIGPSLGGFITENFSWRGIFYINVPVGLVALWMSIKFINVDQEKHQIERFDLVGAGIFTAGLVTLLIGLNQGHALGWTSLPILGAFSAAIILFILFFKFETKTKYPMLDFSLFKRRLFTTSVSSATLAYISVYTILFLMPFYLIQGRGFPPSHAGLLLTAQPMIMAVIAPLSGALSDRIGTRIPTISGLLLLSFGLLCLSRIGSTSSTSDILIGLIFTGLGIGIFGSPNNSALMSTAPRKQQGIAAGILATARNMGMALGVGLAGAILSTYIGIPTNTGSAALFSAINISFIVAAAIAFLGALIITLSSRTQ